MRVLFFTSLMGKTLNIWAFFTYPVKNQIQTFYFRFVGGDTFFKIVLFSFFKSFLPQHVISLK